MSKRKLTHTVGIKLKPIEPIEFDMYDCESNEDAISRACTLIDGLLCSLKGINADVDTIELTTYNSEQSDDKAADEDIVLKRTEIEELTSQIMLVSLSVSKLFKESNISTDNEDWEYTQRCLENLTEWVDSYLWESV